jgi:cell division protein FtsL
MIRAGVVFAGLLVLLGTFSATGVVAAQHRARELHTALEYERNRTRALEEEWGNLQIRQSMYAAHGKVEKIAREKLGMVPLALGQIMVLEIEP